MRKKPAMKKFRLRNAASMVTISVIVIMLLIALRVSTSRLEEKKAVYDEKENYLIARIEEQEKRSEYIEEYRKYTHTKKYIEDLAKERLGLVYKDEIIFEAEN